MKRKLRFIMPRLIGATVITGLAALVITTLFKLLLGITVLAAVISIAGRKLGRRRQLMAQAQQSFGNGYTPANSAPWANGFAGASQKASTIVPVN